jgi:hypothetical protein
LFNETDIVLNPTNGKKASQIFWDAKPTHLKMCNGLVEMVNSVSTDTILIGIAAVWSLLLPFYPDTLFVLLDGVVGVFLLLFVALMALPYGAVPGILVFVAVALTFVERNRRKINKKIIDVPSVTYQQQLAPSPPMSEEEVHPAYDSPQEEEVPFYPEENASDSFEPVGSSINDKQVIRTLTPDNDATERLYVQQNLGDTELKEIPRVF